MPSICGVHRRSQEKRARQIFGRNNTRYIHQFQNHKLLWFSIACGSSVSFGQLWQQITPFRHHKRQWLVVTDQPSSLR